MTNSDAAEAIPKLVRQGVLPAASAPKLLREARGELLSVHAEMRLLLSLGVLLVMGGVGVLVAENLDRIGPLVIAVALGLAAAGVLAWVVKTAPPFTWGRVDAPHLALDSMLVLAILLAGADLAYVEVKFTALGAQWPWHLLIVAVLAGAAAFRFDSLPAFSLALSTFAAWRGVSVGRVDFTLFDPAVRGNAIACGVLFAAVGFALVRLRRKAHFEPLAVHLGWLLILAGLGAGMAGYRDDGMAWAAGLLATGAALAAGAYRARRFWLFALGGVAAYAALSRLVLERFDFEELGCFWFSATSTLVMAGLLAAQRRLQRPKVAP